MQVIGKYEYGPAQLIGHGAFALVFKGRHTELDHPVAVKQILKKNIPNKMSNIREKEIGILKNIKHNNIVQLYDYHETDIQIYLIMEFCNGGDLADYLHSKKTLSEDSIKHLATHISDALSYIHCKGIIHRDIKPQNLLLSYSSGKRTHIRDSTIKLADFGFARYLLGTDMAATLCGSPLYMAPEILVGNKYDNRVDLWSAGTILYQCLVGSPPFVAKSPRLLSDKYKREALVPRIPEGVSQLLTDLLLKLIKKSPNDRLNYKEFSAHPFIRGVGVTTIAPEVSSSHVKSSPVPIRRSSNSPTAPSPRGQSSHSGGGVSSYMNSFTSPSSGPPIMHTIGSGSYRSPSSNLIMPEDEGFIIVSTGATKIKRSSSSPQVIQPNHAPSTYGRYSGLNSPFYPHVTPPTTTPPRSQDKLSHTPPFSSLFKMVDTRQSSGITPPSLEATPPSRGSPKATPPSVGTLQQESPLSSPVGSRRSFSRQGSHTKLATLVESKHESHDTSCDGSHDRQHGENERYMMDSTDLITPSLFGSDVLKEQLEKLSQRSSHHSVENMFDQLQKKEKDPEKDGHTDKRDVPHSDRRDSSLSSRLSISKELADIRHQERSLMLRKDSLGLSNISLSSPSLSDDDEKGCGLKTSPDSPLNEDIFRLDEDQGDRHIKALQYSINVTQELLKLAKSRQGPMLMLSSSMGESGGVIDHAQRFAEQLVLCVKAVDVISNGYRQYELEAAIESHSNTTSHKHVIDDALTLKSTCLDKARLARELHSKCLSKRRHQSLTKYKVTAEWLIFVQAADLCKQALIEEKSPRQQECIRKYKLSRLFLKLLISDAQSELDRNSLKKYITVIENRLDILLKQ